jgi:hypothetical protein
MNEAKRKMRIDMADLESAFENSDSAGEHTYFFDLETGKVVLVMSEDSLLLEEIYEQHADPETGDIDWPAAMQHLDLPEWRKENLMEVDEVQAGYGKRYIKVPEKEPYQDYNQMGDFIATVSDPDLQERLEWAIRGKGAFRRFKDVIADHPKERERWFSFQEDELRQRIMEWLDQEGIEPA